jgi:hypothetical protein
MVILSTTVPDVLPVRKYTVKSSVLSLIPSAAKTKTNVPELSTTLRLPPEVTTFDGDEKSASVIGPEILATVQYNVPVPNSVVVIVNVIVSPSL